MQRRNSDRCTAAASSSANAVVAQHGGIIGAKPFTACRSHGSKQLIRVLVETAGDVAVGRQAHGRDNRRCAPQQEPLCESQRFAQVPTASQHIPAGQSRCARAKTRRGVDCDVGVGAHPSMTLPSVQSGSILRQVLSSVAAACQLSAAVYSSTRARYRRVSCGCCCSS